MKFVSKPKYIEAIQYNGNNIEEILNFIGKENVIELKYEFETKRIYIHGKNKKMRFNTVLC